ncbi:MAG: DnaB-like helicase C-terminal domain-containing protein [Agathobacter sp.]
MEIYGNKDVLYIEDFQQVLSGRSGQIKTFCPFCRESRTNKRDRSLSINTETLAYHCHYCDAKGYLKSRMGEILARDQRYFKSEPKKYVKPKPKDIDKAEKFGKSFLDWFKGRGISEHTLIKAKVTQEPFPYGKEKKGCVAFNYYFEDELINVKYRTRDKQFAQVSGAKLIPYNINSIAPEAFQDGEEKYVLITEGEMDALTYIECGYEHVVSVPSGATGNLDWLDDFIDSHFEPLDIYYISTDNDKKGLEERQELIRRLGRDRCCIIDYPKPCKDINEVLMQYGKDEVKKCVDNRIELKMEGVQELVDVETELDYLFNNGLQKGATIEVPELDKILSFKTGLLSVVTGVPSHGKTFFLNFILARLNLIHNWKVAFFSPEFYPVSTHIAQIIETLGGARFSAKNYSRDVYDKMKEYICKNFFWISPDDTDINSVMDRSKYLIRKKGIKALVIDPFNALTDKSRKNQKQDEYISDFLQKLRWFARKFDIAVFLVMHPTKLTKLENGLYPVCDLYNCKGASEIFDKADVGLTVWRNELEDYAELHVTKIKFRHLGEKGKAAFKFNINNGRYVSIENPEDMKKQGYDIKTMQIEYDNRNYIIEKLNNPHTQELFILPSADYSCGINNDFSNSEFDDNNFNPFNTNGDDSPF